MKKEIILLIIVLFIPIFGFTQTKYIVLDPGHQWDNTTGVLTPARTVTEVLTNLAVAQNLEQIINFDSNIDWEVRLTREDNNAGTNVTFDDRELIANNLEDLHPEQVYFLSIHCNGGGGTGTETFYCNNTFSTNNSHLERYAQNIQDNMVEVGGWSLPEQNRRCVEDASYYGYHLSVLDELTMPNCLNEIGFVDNVDDEAKLLSNYWRWMFAKAYFEGLKEAFSDLNLISVNVQNLPCYADNNYLCQINITVKNITNETYYGDVKAVLREFPMNVYDDPSSEFCQIGSSQSVYIRPQEQRTLTFSTNVPFTVRVGMALCVDSKKYNEFDWKTVPTPQHKKVIRIPLNAARITGIVYDNKYNPLQGAEIWSYEKSSNKSMEFSKSNDLTFDPTKAITDNTGEYEILMPSDWNEGVVSFVNYFNYDEKLVSPIEDKFFYHYYTTSPVIIDIGSGTSVDCAGYVGSNPGNPIELYRPIDHFQNLTVNGHEDITCVGKDDNITLGVSPKPINYSKLTQLKCDGGYTTTTVFYSKIDCSLAWDKDCDCSFLFFGCDCDWIVEYWVYLTKVDDDLNPISNTISKKMRHVIYNGDISYLDLEPFLIGDISINEAIRQALNEEGGGLYKLKIGYVNEFDDWCDKSTFIYLEPDDQNFNNLTLDGTYYGRNIYLTNSNINGDISLIATKKITITSSRIAGNFHANLNGAAYCSEVTKNISREKFEESKSKGIIKTTEKSKIVLPNREVEQISKNCSCKNENDLFKTSNINIFPNPTRSILNINISNNKNSQIEIYDVEGKIVETIQTKSDETVINVSNYKVGIYTIRITNSGNTTVHKFSKF